MSAIVEVVDGWYCLLKEVGVAPVVVCCEATERADGDFDNVSPPPFKSRKSPEHRLGENERSTRRSARPAKIARAGEPLRVLGTSHRVVVQKVARERPRGANSKLGLSGGGCGRGDKGQGVVNGRWLSEGQQLLSPASA